MVLTRETLVKLCQVTKPKAPSLSTFLEQSQAFEEEMGARPVDNWMGEGFEDGQACINGSYPVVHESVLPLMEAFARGAVANAQSREEKEVYNANFWLLDLIQRLVANRPLAFLNSNDRYLLRDGTSGHGWEKVGKERYFVQSHIMYFCQGIFIKYIVSNPVDKNGKFI